MTKAKPTKKTPPKKCLENQFYQELIRVLRAFDMYDCWKRLPKKIQAEFMTNILRPMRFERDAASGVEANVISALKKDIRQIVDACYLNLKPYKSELPLHDFLTAGVALIGSIEMFIEPTIDDFDQWIEFKEIIKGMLTKEENNPMIMISAHFNNMCHICTSIDRAYYWYAHHKHLPTRSEAYLCLVYTLRKKPTEKAHVTIDGKSRPVYRLGISERGGVTWAVLTAPQPDSGTGAAVKLPVYVQVHALERMKERLTPLEKYRTQVLLYEAFEKPEFSFGPDGSPFIAFRYNGVKIGYLTYETIDSMVVVTTFLLITQNGTHEGNALNKAYGLSRYAKTYFELDKLNTFIKTDVYKDEELKALFAKCGCEGLFHVWDGISGMDLSFDKEYAKNLKKIFIT